MTVASVELGRLKNEAVEDARGKGKTSKGPKPKKKFSEMTGAEYMEHLESSGIVGK